MPIRRHQPARGFVGRRRLAASVASATARISNAAFASQSHFNHLDGIGSFVVGSAVNHKVVSMEIYNASAKLTSDALMCFASAPQQVVFRPGENLFRFGTIVSASFKGNDIFGSPWWVPPTTYRQITKTAHRTGASIVDVARSGLSVAVAWNPKMDWLTILELKKAVYGWVGPAKPQPLYGGNQSVMLLGNYHQAYVPDLAPADAISSEAAMLSYFGSALG